MTCPLCRKPLPAQTARIGLGILVIEAHPQCASLAQGAVKLFSNLLGVK